MKDLQRFNDEVDQINSLLEFSKMSIGEMLNESVFNEEVKHGAHVCLGYIQERILNLKELS